MVLGALSGWLERRERRAIVYLIEENRLLRRQWGRHRLRLTETDRSRLAARAHRVAEPAAWSVHVLICDRDRKWSSELRRQLQDAEIRVVRTPACRAECEHVRRTLCAVDQGRMS